MAAAVGDGGDHMAPTTAASSGPPMVVMFVCQTCAKSFPTAAALGGHSSKKCGQLKHRCGKCRARFARQQELQRHRCEEGDWYEVVVAEVGNTHTGHELHTMRQLKLSDADMAAVKLALDPPQQRGSTRVTCSTA